MALSQLGEDPPLIERRGSLGPQDGIATSLRLAKNASQSANRRPTPADQDEPLLNEAEYLDGGVQSLRWVEDTLQSDEDGDRAHGFFTCEVHPPQEAGRSRKLEFLRSRL